MMRLAKRGPRVGVGMKPARANEEVATCAKCGKKIKRKDLGHRASSIVGAKSSGMLCPKCAKGKRGLLGRMVDMVAGR